MAEKISKLFDLPVKSAGSGARLGRVWDVLVDPATLRIAGYLVWAGGILQLRRFLREQDVQDKKGGALWVRGKSSLRPAKAARDEGDLRRVRESALGKEIRGQGGAWGAASDLWFDGEFGEITHFEVSNGFSEDILHGRKKIPINNADVFGNNKIEINSKGE